MPAEQKYILMSIVMTLSPARVRMMPTTKYGVMSIPRTLVSLCMLTRGVEDVARSSLLVNNMRGDEIIAHIKNV
jgi:hypothetical protein